MVQNNTAPIGIIGAMKSEMDRIKATVEDQKITRIGGTDYVEGKVHGVPVVVATCGIGKVFAGICAQTMILKFHPAMIVNVGVAGSLSRDLNIGDIAVAASVVQHDMDTSGIGDPPGLISGINMIWIPSDPDMVAGMEKSAEAAGFHRVTGAIASGDLFVTDGEKKKSIARSFQAVACEMEGGAIGQTCHVNGVPFCVLRAISDNGDENATDDYGISLDMAADRASQVLDGWLKAIGDNLR